MGTLDIILLICFIPALVRGIQKGFIEQIISLASIFIGAWMAYRFAEPLSVWLTQFINVEPKILGVASFAIVVILTVILLNLLGKLLTKTLKMASLGLTTFHPKDGTLDIVEIQQFLLCSRSPVIPIYCHAA